jgi:uncharacterized protein
MVQSLFLFVIAAGFCAGFFNSLVGGGGLIQLPALLLVYPNLPFAEVSSINKMASFLGLGMALLKYNKDVPFSFSHFKKQALAAFVFALAGAWCVSRLPNTAIKPISVFVLGSVTWYTYRNKSLGALPRTVPYAQFIFFLSVCAIGFYDGFFGPGSGSFFIFSLVLLRGVSFLQASAEAKFLNFLTNLAALVVFSSQGHFRPDIFLPVAAANMTGAYLGVRFAIGKGPEVVRKIFLVVTSALLLKLIWDFCRDRVLV